ncbi:MAG TPA: dienelactone hydrolase family protein [Candidatus Cybelea sp.]|nr:dienelactone hydrolase family protein [Candidatus Cybelea sp.]
MKRAVTTIYLVIMGTLLLVAARPAPAQDWARAQLEKSPRHREWATLKHDGRSLETLVVYPEAKDKRPVVLVIHEIFGLTDWAEDVSDEMAEAGYIAVAPDLLSGMAPGGGRSSDLTQSQAIEAVGHLNPDQITADLNAAADYALKLPASNGKLFVMGFCWGGGQSFRYATSRRDLRAAFVFYGPPPPKEAMEGINAPVYGFYGGADERIDATIPGASEAMKSLAKRYEPVTYAGAGHGFMRAGEAPDTTPANAKARQQAWERLKALLTQNE